MDLNTISKKKGWILSKIIGSINLQEKIVIVSFNSINRYNLNPCSYVNIKSINHSNIQGKFLLLPFIEHFRDNIVYIKKIWKYITELTNIYHIDKDYLNNLYLFINQLLIDNEMFEFLDLDYYTEEEENLQQNSVKIGLPDHWLNDNHMNLGELVLLRNDCPSPIIY